MNKLGQILSFFSGKGGVGKSHICAAMGLALSAQKKSVLWIDMDLGWRNLDFILKCDRDIVFDLNHVFQGGCHWREALITVPSAPHSHLIAGSLTQVFTPAMSHLLRELLSQARQSYDYILVDLGSGFDPIHEMILELCDRPVMISTTDLSSLRSIDKILGVIAAPKKPLWILNQYSSTLENLKTYCEEMNYPVSVAIPLFSSKGSFWSHIFGSKKQLIHEKIIPYLEPLAISVVAESSFASV